MRRATSQNRKPIKEREREIIHEIDKKHEEEPFEFTKKDILAMIIAGYQLIMPIVIIGAIVFSIFGYIFLKFFMR